MHADKKSVQEDLKDHSSCSTQTKEPDQPTSDDLKAEDKAEDTTDGVVKDESPLNILRQAKSSIVTLDDATVVQHIEATELSPDTQAIFAILRATALGIGMTVLWIYGP